MSNTNFSLTIESVRVDTLPPFVQLAAETPALYREIDNLHALDSARYFRVTQHSPYYNHPYFIGGGIEREIYARKYLGLLLCAIQDGLDSPLFTSVFGLMSKRWETLYSYIRSCKEADFTRITALARQSPALTVNPVRNKLSEVTNRFLQSFVTSIPNPKQSYQNALKFSLFAARIHNCKVIAKDQEILPCIQAFGEKAPSPAEFQTIKRRLLSPNIKKMARDLKNSILQQLRSEEPNPWSEDRLIEGWAHCWAHLLSEEELPFLQHDLRTRPKDRDVELLCRIFFIKITAEWFRSDHIHETAEELEKACAEFVMLGWIGLQLVREYKKARRYYVVHHADHLWQEVDAQKEKNLQYEEKLRRAANEIAAQTYLLELKNKELLEQAHRHKQEIDALKAELSILKSATIHESQPEMIQMAPEPSVGGTEELSSVGLSLPDTLNDLKKLQEVRAVVIGGTEKWQTKLSNHLPHFTYLHGDAAGFDETLVINTDIVFADVRFKFDHSCYYRLADIIRRHNKKLVFLSKTNIPLAVHQMASAVS